MSTLRVNDIIEATSGGGKIWHSRAWVNFNGTGTVAIRADGNVSSITDVGTGQYNINFSNSIADANYAVAATNTHHTAVTYSYWVSSQYGSGADESRTTSKVNFGAYDASAWRDTTVCNLQVTR